MFTLPSNRKSKFSMKQKTHSRRFEWIESIERNAKKKLRKKRKEYFFDFFFLSLCYSSNIFRKGQKKMMYLNLNTINTVCSSTRDSSIKKNVHIFLFFYSFLFLFRLFFLYFGSVSVFIHSLFSFTSCDDIALEFSKNKNFIIF